RRIYNKGIKLLCDYFKFSKTNLVTALDLSFTLVPVINASGRLDDASFVVSLFNGNESKEIVDELIRINEKRKSLTNEAFELVKLDYNEKIYVCFIDNISEGLLGIISGKILNSTKKPTFVFTKTNDLIKGSGRSLENFDLHENIKNMDLDFNSFGGHKRAVGLSFTSMEEFNKFKKLVQNFYVPNPITYFITFNYSFYDAYKTISSLEPIGEGIKIPYFYINGNICDIRIINEKHTSFRMLVNGKMERFIYYNCVLEAGNYDLLFELKKNDYGIQAQVYKAQLKE
ncbi:MAG: hypothetical protein K6E24_05115, partial [bacterium]|nr:hypothetical protein [bacterium]